MTALGGESRAAGLRPPGLASRPATLSSHPPKATSDHAPNSYHHHPRAVRRTGRSEGGGAG